MLSSNQERVSIPVQEHIMWLFVRFNSKGMVHIDELEKKMITESSEDYLVFCLVGK